MATTEAQYSMILVDAFDGFEIVQDTVSEPFLHDCQQALKAGGALVLNLWGSDPRFARQLAVVQQVFDGWAFGVARLNARQYCSDCIKAAGVANHAPLGHVNRARPNP